MKDYFSHVEHWVFDLDNTLYPPEFDLFKQIEIKMTNYVMRTLGVSETEATTLRDHYWRKYGTTLSGMMLEHNVDPMPYLSEVHEISLEHVTQDLTLRSNIAALRGRKIVYTNGSQLHAQRVLEARGLSGLFDAVYGIEHSDFHPKPAREAYDAIVARDGFDPAAAAMFEDDPRNLEIPHALGMQTVLIGPAHQQDYIHHQSENLTAFLSQIIA